MLKSVFSALLLLYSFSYLQAQRLFPGDSVKVYQRIDISYILGGQIYNNNFIYNPGLSLQASYGLRLNESTGIGIGAGYYALQDERFIPIFIEATGCRKNKEFMPMIVMKAGYAPAWYTGRMEVDGYSFRGGLFIDAGMGRRFNISKEYSLFFHWSYRHQFARMEYGVFGGQHYSEVLNYDMLLISLGIIRRCP